MFNYQELEFIRNAISDVYQGEDTEVYKKVVNLLDTMWMPGSILPPMYAKFLIRTESTFPGAPVEEYFARRTDLAESYSPSTIKLQVNIEGEEWEEQTLNVGEFKWRYL